MITKIHIDLIITIKMIHFVVLRIILSFLIKHRFNYYNYFNNDRAVQFNEMK